MRWAKGRQKAGDSSSQVQVQRDINIYQGVSEERAKEIAQTVARSVVAEYSAEANTTAERRIGDFDSRLVAVLSQNDQLDVFADPSFQVALKKAQIGAASTERESDYDMLAGLLADRALRGERRTVRAGIDKAVQIIDQVDDDALVGLTVLQAAIQFGPTSGNLNRGLDALDTLFGQLMENTLPAGIEWIEHLDILDAVRSVNVGIRGMQDFSAYMSKKMTGYVSPGIEVDSEEESRANLRIADVQVQLPIVEHELRPGYRRIGLVNMNGLEKRLKNLDLDDEKREATLAIARDEYHLDEVHGPLLTPFASAIDARRNLGTLRQWWDEIPRSVQITVVGRVLARANAKRCDQLGQLPELE